MNPHLGVYGSVVASSNAITVYSTHWPTDGRTVYEQIVNELHFECQGSFFDPEVTNLEHELNNTRESFYAC